MLGATFFMKGSVCEVPVRLEFQVQGAAKSIVLTCEKEVSLTEAWRELGKALEKTAGFGLPDIPEGPWTQILDAKLILSAWLTAGDAGGRGMSAYVGMDFSSPLHIGGTKTWGDISITLEPDIAILGVYIAYDPQEGGVDVRCKVLTPTTPSGSPDGLADGSPTPPFSKMVSFPPPLPAQNSVSAFKLKYLGIGQRVGPEVVVHGDDPMAEIFEILETQLTGNDLREVLTRLARTFYHPDRDWFIAAHLLMRGWDLKVLFNDPTMYGLEISAPRSSPPDFFSGFLFEILYQKLGPNLGVYFGRIDLPTNLRRIPLNGFILILPNFSAWIYTNGDFRINVGWPLGDNSIGIQMDVLTGRGGFYFARLRTGDDPGALPSVNYNPILAFGIGLSVSASVSADAGVLSASLSVSVSATLQGLLAWKGTQSGGSASIASIPDHYWFAGTAGLSILLQGSVNFVVIKASISVSLTANVDVAFETGYSTLIAASATVDVSASVKVVFFTIHFHFSTHISHSFTIGSGPNASPDGPLAPGLSIAAPRLLAADRLEADGLMAEVRAAIAYSQATLPAGALDAASLMARSPRFAMPLSRQARQPARPQAPSRLSYPAGIDLYFALLPTVLYGGAGARVELIATLVAEAPPPGGSPLPSPEAATGFERVVVDLVAWLLTYVPPSSPADPLSTRLATLAGMLGNGAEEPGPAFGGADGFTDAVRGFLADSFVFTIHPVTPASPALPQSMAVLPMFDVLELHAPGSPGTVDFGTFNPVPATYREAVDVYYADLGLLGRTPPMADKLEAGATPPPSMATIVIGDFFLMLARKVVNDLAASAATYEAQQTARLPDAIATARAAAAPLMALHRAITDHVAAIDPAVELAHLIDTYDFSGAAGLGSRFMLGGLQLPVPSQIPPVITPETMRNVPLDSLFRLTGQAFSGVAPGTTAEATLGIAGGGTLPWIELPPGSPPGARAAFDVPATLPPDPDPVWHLSATPGDMDGVGPGEIALRPLPPVSGAPMAMILKQQVAWTTPAGAFALHDLPQPLMDLAQKPGGLRLALSERPPSGSPPVSAASPAAGRAGLLIRLTVSQVPAAGGGSVPYVYQLGGADEATRELIYRALQDADFTDASISLLYAKPGETGFTSDTLSSGVLVARTNLSTDNQVAQTGSLQMLRMLGGPSTGTHSALLSDPAGFLRLIWEVSVVQAPGYTLYYRTATGADLPADLFADTAATIASPTGTGAGVVAGTSGLSAPFALLVTFASAPADPVPVPACANCIVAAAGSPAITLGARVLDGTSQPVLSYSQSLPTGYAGFAMDWTQGTDSPDAALPVQHLYSLVQYAVSGTGFIRSDWSLPVGPTGAGDGSPDAPWHTQQTLPLYRFLAAGSPNGSPAPDPSPYDIVGMTATLAFRLTDLFGNPLPDSHALPFAPLYTDPLSGPGDWPGVEACYSVSPLSGQDAAALAITLTFHLDSLEPPHASPGDPSAYWTALAERYGAIAQQMADAGTHVALETTLMGGGSPVVEGSPDAKSVLAAFTARIASLLAGIAQTGTRPSPGVISAALDGVVGFRDIVALTGNVVELEVWLHLWRDADRVDPDVQAKMPAAVSLTATIPPDWGGLYSPHPGRVRASGSRNFAQGFEQAFAGFAGPGSILKLAQRSGVGSGDTANQVPDLWAVRFSDTAGIGISFHPQASPGFSPGKSPVFFALAPLATSAMSGTVDEITYGDIDIDAWALDYLVALDGVLSAEVGTALALLDTRYGTTHFEDLLGIKTRLARGVVQAVTQVLADQQGMGDAAGAQERLTQAMLTTLASAYGVSTIVQVPAEVTVVGTADDGSPEMAPQFYGTLGPASTGSGAAQPFSLSAATLDVEGPATQWVTALLTVAQPRQERSIQLPLDFTISYMQHDFLVDEAYQGIIPSSWLKFVLPGDAALSHVIAASPGIEIPVPLPFDPPLPVLQGQSGTGAPMPPPVSPFTPDSVRKEIEDALKWAYSADLSLDIAGQDQLFLDLTFNGTAGRARSLAATVNVKSLFEALARFRAVWGDIAAQIPAILKEAYPDLGSPAIHSPGTNPSPASPEPRDVLPLLVARATDVARAWTDDVFATRLALAPAAETLHLILEREQLSDPDTARVRLFAKAGGGGVPDLWPDLANQDGSLSYTPDPSSAVPVADGWYRIDMTVSAALDFGQLRLTFGPLDLTTRRSGDLSTWVVRNADLIDGAATNPAFIYVSPTVSFKSATIPIISRPALSPIRLDGITLVQVLTDILAPLADMSADFEPNLTFVANWSAALTRTASGEALRVGTPVSLVNDTPLGSGTSGAALAREIAQGIWDWYGAMRPPSLDAQLNLSLTLFGTIDSERLPIFQVGDIPILVPDVRLLDPGAG